MARKCIEGEIKSRCGFRFCHCTSCFGKIQNSPLKPFESRLCASISTFAMLYGCRHS